MSAFNKQIVWLWDQWIKEIGQESGDPEDFVEWAQSKWKLAPRLQDVKKILRKQVTQALRQEKRYDEEGGFPYRAKQCITLFENHLPVKHYFDTDKGGTPTLRQKSVKQRREAVAHDVYRAACDVERMNKVFPDDPQLSFVFDFSDDVAELRAAEKLSNDNSEAA